MSMKAKRKTQLKRETQKRETQNVETHNFKTVNLKTRIAETCFKNKSSFEKQAGIVEEVDQQM